MRTCSFRNGVTGTLLLLVLVLSPAAAGGPWWNSAWRFRVPVEISAGSVDRIRKPADLAVNFTTLAGSAGAQGTFDPATIRVVEVNDVGAVIRDSVAFQFDPAPDYHATTKAAGSLVVLLDGLTPAYSSRTYHIYFDFAGTGIPPAAVSPQVTVTDSIPDEGQECFRVSTPSGTIFYQKVGAGFSSWLDRDSIDWVGYNPTPNSLAAGSSRGIPNSTYPRGFFHPGSDGPAGSVSTLLARGPLRATVRSVQVDGYFECRWDIYPEYARITMVRTDTAYWILYEGTPGGELEPAVDKVVRSDGRETLASEMWIEDIPGEEWVYFADPNVNRSLFVYHEEDDQIIDQYYAMTTIGPPLTGSMTVFGFGRQSHYMYLYDTPQHFVFGIVDGTAYGPTAALVRSAGGDLASTFGQAEQQIMPVAALLLPADGAVNQGRTPRLVWHAYPGAQEYRVQVARDSSFAPAVLVANTTTTDTTFVTPVLQINTTYYWRVAVTDQSSSFPYGPAFRFTTVAGLPNQVKLVSPPDGATVRADSVVCRWEGLLNTDRYAVEWSEDPFFTAPAVDSLVTDTVKVLSVPEGPWYWRVKGGNLAGWGPYSALRTFVSSLTSVAERDGVPGEFALHQNYPNPFNPVTTIRFQVPAYSGGAGTTAEMTDGGSPMATGWVRIAVVDVLGRDVAVLVNQRMDPGAYEVLWDAAGFPSGAYICRMISGAFGASVRMMLVK